MEATTATVSLWLYIVILTMAAPLMWCLVNLGSDKEKPIRLRIFQTLIVWILFGLALTFNFAPLLGLVQ